MAPEGQDNQKCLGRNQWSDVNKHTCTQETDTHVLVCVAGAGPAEDRVVVVEGGLGPGSFPRGFHSAPAAAC